MWQRSTTRRLLHWLTSWLTVRRALIALACMATFIGLCYTIEHWRGKRAWMEFKNRMEARGERFDLAYVVPKPVPDEQNFAMTPLLKPLLDYSVTNGGIKWHDEEGIHRVEAVDVGVTMRRPQPDISQFGTPELQQQRPPKLNRWTSGERANLKAWQAFYLGNTNYPAPARPGTPAADVLVALSKFDAELAELHAAAARPYSIFPVHYEEGLGTMCKHLPVLRRIAHLTTLRASALLELDRPNEALRDVELTLRFSDALKNEPILISQLVRLAILHVALQPVWHGLADGHWGEPQLVSLQIRLEKLRLLEGYSLAVRGENVILVGQTIEHLRTARYSLTDLGSGGGKHPSGLAYALAQAIPDGWLYQNQLICSRQFLEYFLPVVDLEGQLVDPSAVKAGTKEMDRAVARRTPYNLLARMLLPALGFVPVRFAYSQTMADLAGVACAVERYHLAHSEFPESLDALVPQVIAKLPHDIIADQPLKYRRTENGRFTLYSVGWNQTDDGGEVALKKDRSPDHVNGDWVWKYTAN